MSGNEYYQNKDNLMMSISQTDEILEGHLVQPEKESSYCGKSVWNKVGENYGNGAIK